MSQLTDHFDFTDKVVIITGASGGIGAGTARAFLDNGAKVSLVDINAEGLEKVRAELNDDERVLVTAADVTSDADTGRYVDATVAKFGTVDILFNNAGIDGKIARIEDTEPEAFDAVMNVNVRAVWLAMHHVLPIMYAKNSGSIVNTASIASHIAGPSPMAAYVASKHAVRGLTHNAAREASRHGVRVNSISPAQVDTDLMRRVETRANPEHPEEARKAYEANLPLGRYAQAEDIANLVLFLSSDAAGYITGADYLVDGGRLA